VPIERASVLVPTYFLFGLYNVMVHNQDGHSASLLGSYGTLGWWYYFPVAFALKTSLPFLGLTVAALCWATWRIVQACDARVALLFVPLALYVGLTMTSHINIGVRHLLPAYPFLFLLGGALLDRLLRAQRSHIAAVAVTLVLGGMGVEAARAYPDYLPYMNQLTWQHPHWFYLADSNVEWGDDVRDLAGYLRERGETRVRAELLGGWATLPMYGVEYVSLLLPPAEQPPTRYVALGASALNGSTVWVPEGPGDTPSHERFAAYRSRVPEAVFGHSIYLYRVTD
jgi:hypothetical protein